MAKDTAAKTTEESAVALYDYGSDAGQGFENQTQDDVKIPFIGIIQSNSKVISEGGLEGAKAGLLHNTVTDDLFAGDKGFEFVPCYTKQWFVEWVPREKGGGFVGKHEVTSDVVVKAKANSKDFGKYVTETGNQLVQTFEIWGVMVTDNGLEPVILSFSSTKIAVYKKWNTKIQMFQLPTKNGGKMKPPIYAHRVRVTTVKQQNTKGTFFNFVLNPADGEIKSSLLLPSDPRFQAAKDLREMINSGAVQAADDSLQSHGGADEDAGDGTFDKSNPAF